MTHVRIFFALITGAILFLSVSTGRAAVQNMKLSVERGDCIGKVLNRHAAALRRFIKDEGPWRHLSGDQLARRLLRRNMRRLPHGIYVGNVVEISRTGDITVVAGRGKTPEPFASHAQLRNLVRAIPDQVHDQVEDLARQGAVPLRAFSVSDDGKSVEVAGKRYRAVGGIRFVARAGHFHVIGDPPPHKFNVAVWPFAGVDFAFPPSPYYRETPDRQIAPKIEGEGILARLLAAGQLRNHDDHYHVTRAFAFEPWQKLIALAASDTAPPTRKSLATSVQVRFLREHLYISSTDSARDLAEIETRLSRLWQAFDAHFDGPELTFVYEYNAAIAQDGKLLHLGEQTLSAGEGLSFGFCTEHVHVIGEPSINVAIHPTQSGEPLILKKNIFVEQQGNRLQLRRLSVRLLELLTGGMIIPSDHHYRIGEGFYPEARRAIMQVASHHKIAPQVRNDLKAEYDTIVKETLNITQEEELFAELAALGHRLEALRAKLPPIPADDEG